MFSFKFVLTILVVTMAATSDVVSANDVINEVIVATSACTDCGMTFFGTISIKVKSSTVWPDLLKSLGQKFTRVCKQNWGLIRVYFESTLANFLCYWAIFHCCNWKKNIAIGSHWSLAWLKWTDVMSSNPVTTKTSKQIELIPINVVHGVIQGL